MLLRFLQKGLTFHNIPLMLGITAQDDENVVYSKQIGAEENKGRPPERGAACTSPSPLEAPHLRAASARQEAEIPGPGPGWGLGIGSDRAGAHPGPGWLLRSSRGHRS